MFFFLADIPVTNCNRLAGQTCPDGSSESYEYEAVGNLVKFIDAFGNDTSYTYDRNHKLPLLTGGGKGGANGGKGNKSENVKQVLLDPSGTLRTTIILLREWNRMR